MDCDKLMYYCLKYNITKEECDYMYLRCKKQKYYIRKRKSLPLPLKFGVERKSRVFPADTR